jgi:hypothetical protein
LREVDLFTALRPWLAEATGIEVIEAYADGARASGAYISVNLIASERLGLAVTTVYEEGAEGVDGIKELFQIPVLPMEWRYSINVFAPDPIDIANRIMMWSQSDGAALRLWPLLIQPITGAKRLPVEVDGQFEGRAQMDIAIRGYIKRGTITDGAGNEILIGRVPVDDIIEGTITLGPDTNPDLVSGDYFKP